ncbi:uncharacterized protein [Ptychodera flava]|uniref:uncharacterized protein n=1 Tax=Ptychodera flava TaxID=63121 RepID=UPI003969D441
MGKLYDYQIATKPIQVQPKRIGLIGRAMEGTVLVEGRESPCLIDTGSQVTTISKDYYDRWLSTIPIQPTDETLEIKGANDQSIPFIGIVEVVMSFSKDVFRDDSEYTIPALVMPSNAYNIQVPILVGTNLLGLFPRDAFRTKTQHSVRAMRISATGRGVFKKLNDRDQFIGSKGDLGSVRALMRHPVKIEPGCMRTILGRSRKGPSGDQYVVSVEPTNEVTGQFTTSPAVSVLKCQQKRSKVPVCVQNVSSIPVTIRPG